MKTDVGSVVVGHRRYQKGGVWTEEQYPVTIEWTLCHYGGKRPWFRCPAKGCGRRVRILYGAGERFTCRLCGKLSYKSQRRPAHERALLKAQKIRMLLGGSGNLTKPFPDKPKGMHWRSYYSLMEQERLANAASWPQWLLKLNAQGSYFYGK